MKIFSRVTAKKRQKYFCLSSLFPQHSSPPLNFNKNRWKLKSKNLYELISDVLTQSWISA